MSNSNTEQGKKVVTITTE